MIFLSLLWLTVTYIHQHKQFFLGTTAPQWARASSFTRFLYHTQQCTTVCRNPLYEWSARHRDLYLTTHNTHDRHPCPPVGFEPTISAGKRPQSYALDRAATGTGNINISQLKYVLILGQSLTFELNTNIMRMFAYSKFIYLFEHAKSIILDTENWSL